jgi:hypothetical protein
MRSHGGIWLAHSAIGWLVRSIGAAELAATPL